MNQPLTSPTETSGDPLYPAVRVVHPRVADLDRAPRFYRDAGGFTVTADTREAGLDMVLLAAGDTTIT